MKIAVTYENGQVFQHFGRTAEFKLYEVADGQVLGAQVVSSNGSGHGALAQILADLDVQMLICGGIGGGAQAALAEQGILVCSGAEGDTDEVVAAFLRGELTSAGTNCDHHHGEEEHHCGEGGCGSSCGGGCGGCHHDAPETKNGGKTCKVHYRGTFNDGTQFDSSYDRGEPLEFICGAGMMIPGFDAAVADMEVGQSVDVHLMPEEAYGYRDDSMVFTLEIAQLPGSEDLVVDQRVYLYNSMGQPMPVVVAAKDETTITFDANHQMAGQELNFHIELVEVV